MNRICVQHEALDGAVCSLFDLRSGGCCFQAGSWKHLLLDLG